MTRSDGLSASGDFNPRSREGSDRSAPSAPCKCLYFNPRSREGSDWVHAEGTQNCHEFQSTLPRGERQFPVSLLKPHQLFQSTLPRGERQITLLTITGNGQNFNPRSREGSDQSAPCGSFPASRFQSTLPRGERLEMMDAEMKERHISIHAPARGATGRKANSHATIINFNPRSREGSDKAAGTAGRWRVYFNPRSREGSDQECAELVNCFFYFNPRSREGSDLKLLMSVLGVRDFNPRSREGSDVAQSVGYGASAGFQSTLPRGERRCMG